MRHISYNEPIKAGQSSIQAEQVEYLDKNVRFSLRHCSTKRDECISTIVGDRKLLQALYNRFGHFEQMTWQQARGADHRNSLSIESKTTSNHQLYSKEFPQFQTFCHMRVNYSSKPKFRIFGAIQQDCFCVLKFDVDGKQNH